MEPPELSTVLRSVVTGVGGYLPDRVVTNEELAKLVETSDESTNFARSSFVTTLSGK